MLCMLPGRLPLKGCDVTSCEEFCLPWLNISYSTLPGTSLNTTVITMFNFKSYFTKKEMSVWDLVRISICTLIKCLWPVEECFLSFHRFCPITSAKVLALAACWLYTVWIVVPIWHLMAERIWDTYYTKVLTARGYPRYVQSLPRFLGQFLEQLKGRTLIAVM